MRTQVVLAPLQPMLKLTGTRDGFRRLFLKGGTQYIDGYRSPEA